MFRKIEKRKVLDSLSRHKDITDEFFNQVKSIPKEILENVGTDIAKKAISMSREVDADLYSHKAFMRLSVSKYGILYAKTNMEHWNEEKLLLFFKKRFPQFIIILESERGTFTINKTSNILLTNQSLEEVLKDLEESLPELPFLDESKERDYRELWESFAQSQIIQSRKSSKQIKNLSKKWKSTVPVDKTIITLDKFFE